MLDSGALDFVLQSVFCLEESFLKRYKLKDLLELIDKGLVNIYERESGRLCFTITPKGERILKGEKYDKKKNNCPKNNKRTK